MSYSPNNPNGQANMANSSPVVLASDQTSIPVGVNNGPGAAAVNIQDGGNAITVDGIVSANLNSGTNYVGKARLTDGITDAEVVPLTGYNAQAVAIVDGSGTQITSFGGGTQYADGTTVAIPTGTVALGFDGTDVQAVRVSGFGYLETTVVGTVTVSDTSLSQVIVNDGGPLIIPAPGVIISADNSGAAATIKSDGTNLLVKATGDEVSGNPDSGNPVKIGFVAETSLPIAVADGSRVNGGADRYGRQLITHIDPSMQIWDTHESTTIQTGVNFWTPTAGNRFVVTELHIATGGTTSGLVTIWGAQSATTAYTPGTDQTFFRGEFAPSANSKPGAIISPGFPMFSDTTNDCLKISTSTAMTVYIQVFGYEITP